MQDLDTLKTLQTDYQKKFALLLKLQEELSLFGEDAMASPDYMRVKQEWILAGNELKAYLEKNNKV